MSSGAGIKPRTAKKEDPLARRVPRNPKYRNVEAVVDSGSSMTKYLKRLEEIRTNYKYKSNELFKRMKITTFVQLIIQVSSVDEDIFFDEPSEAGDSRPSTTVSEMENLGNGDNMDTARTEDAVTENGDSAYDSARDTSRSTLHGLITGTGEFDLKSSDNKSNPPISDVNSQPDPNLLERPFLVLDVRDQDEFNQCHVISAENFPIAMLSRSCNYESKSMLAYKNQPGKIILMYDEDERVAPKAATTLVERGYHNLFLLSGGLKVASKLYPTGLITGTIPASLAPANKGTPISQPTKTMFTREDVFALLDQTETAVTDNSSSSRLSRASRASSRSTVPPSTARSGMSTNSTSSQVLHRKPFR